MDKVEARRLLDEVISAESARALGFIVTGSIARGTATRHSDLDVYVVLPDDHPPRSESLTARLDVIPIRIGALEDPPEFGTSWWWHRWSFAWTRVERDLTGGRIGAAALRQATLSPLEQHAVLVDHECLDGYLNLAYRALKSDRAGRREACRLDAAEAVPWFLDTLFALVGRVRPYNGYLAWELENHPPEGLEATEVMGVVEGHLAGDPDAVRKGFLLVERRASAWDAASGSGALGNVFASWGNELALFRDS